MGTASTSLPTITRRAPERTNSIRTSLSGAIGSPGGVPVTHPPSHAQTQLSLAQMPRLRLAGRVCHRAPAAATVNNWLFDNPCRRAHALGDDPQLLFRQPTAPCPVAITSRREIFGIGVWSVIRLCRHHPTHLARRPSAEEYDDDHEKLIEARYRYFVILDAADASQSVARSRRDLVRRLNYRQRGAEAQYPPWGIGAPYCCLCCCSFCCCRRRRSAHCCCSS
jgi:hypothetical protein